MKDSGVEWIGKIPEHWGIASLFQLGAEVKKKNGDLQEQNLLSLSYGKIKRKDIKASEGLVPATFDGYNVIEAGDIVLRLTDLQNDHTSLRVGMATERGIITSAYTTIRPIDLDMSSYLYYVLHSFDIRKGFYGMGSGVRQGLGFGEAKTLRLPVPPDDERAIIVDYLDSACTYIDAAITESKASVEEYKLLRQSVIAQADTKGLDLNVPMKDSGVHWIGKVPCSWDTPAARFFVAIEHGADPTTEGDTPVFVSGTDSFKTCGEYKTGPAVLLGRKGSIANPNYVQGKYWNVDTAFNATSRSSEYLLRFYYYTAMCFDYGYYLTSTALPSMTQADYKSMRIPVPCIEDQERIVSFLDAVCTNIDNVVDEKRSVIADLESYKKSLIYEVVTGKRRVA